MRNTDDFDGQLNQLIQVFVFQKTDKKGRPYPGYSKTWFPNPETAMTFIF